MHEKSLYSCWLVLYKRRFFIFFTTLLSLAVGAVASFVLVPVYEAKILFYVPDGLAGRSYLSHGALNQMKRDYLIPTTKTEMAAPFMEMLKSRTMAKLVQAEFPQKSIKRLLKNDIDFELTDYGTIELNSRDKDPVTASNIANSYIMNLNHFLQTATMENLEYDSTVLRDKLQDVSRIIENLEDRKRGIYEDNNVVFIEEEVKKLTEMRIDFIDAIEDKQIYKAEIGEKIAEISLELTKEGLTLAAHDVAMTNPMIEYLQIKLSDIAAEKSALLVDHTEVHPDIINLDEQYAEVSKQLKREVSKMLSSRIKTSNTFYEKLRQDLIEMLIEKSTVDASISGIEKSIQSMDSRLDKLPSILVDIGRVEHSIYRYKSMLETLELAYIESLMQMERDVEFISVLDRAEVPEKPDFPLLWLNLLVGLLIGLLLGVFYAYIVDYINNTKRIRIRKIAKALIRRG